MKDYIWSMKLAAACGVLVASVAFAGQDEVAALTDIGDPDELEVVQLKESETPKAVQRPKIVQSLTPELSGGGPGRILFHDINPARVKPPKYRIGVSCQGPIPPPIRHQLDLNDKQGVIVVEVLPDSPAAKAGIQKHDILISGNDRPLAGVIDLIEVIETAEGKSVTFVAIRKGKQTTIEVTPEENPDWKSTEALEQSTGVAPPYPELDRLLEWFERTHPRAPRPSMRLRFMHPGMILPPEALMHPNLPGGMSITILKRGEEPTQITVKRGDEEWKVDEKGVEQLPDDIRPHVERMLHGMVIAPDAAMPKLDFMPDWRFRRVPSDEPLPPTDATPSQSARDRIEQRFERMNQRLEKIQEMMERLQREKGPEEEK